METIDVILDVDTGIDDAMALLFAVAREEFNILAVSCVAGNASLERVGRNTREILDLAGARDIPVVLGADRPLAQDAAPAGYVHGLNGVADLELSDYGDVGLGEVDPGPASEVLRDVILNNPRPVTIIELAPMTNLALLFRDHPEVLENVAKVFVMGGAATIGNATPVAEFNTWHDPEAADICLKAAPSLLYPLEVFYSPRVTDEDIATLRSSPNRLANLAGDLLAGIAEPYAGEPRVTAGRYRSCIGDAGLVCLMVNPELATIRRHPVRVSLTDPLTRGMTVVDQRWVDGRDVQALPMQWSEPIVEVALEIDGDAIVRMFMDTLLR